MYGRFFDVSCNASDKRPSILKVGVEVGLVVYRQWRRLNTGLLVRQSQLIQHVHILKRVLQLYLLGRHASHLQTQGSLFIHWLGHLLGGFSPFLGVGNFNSGTNFIIIDFGRMTENKNDWQCQRRYCQFTDQPIYWTDWVRFDCWKFELRDHFLLLTSGKQQRTKMSDNISTWRTAIFTKFYIIHLLYLYYTYIMWHDNTILITVFSRYKGTQNWLVFTDITFLQETGRWRHFTSVC